MTTNSENHSNSKDETSQYNTPPPLPNMRRLVTERFKVCLIILSVYLILGLFKVGCPIKTYSGVSCPGCGMTRAIGSALDLHFDRAFYYHPLFFLTPVMFLFFLFDDFIKRKPKTVFWSIIILLFIGVYLYRLLFTFNDVVTIDFPSGKVLELLHKIIAWEG